MLIILSLQYHKNIRRSSAAGILWRNLYKQADLSSFLHLTGLSRRAFAMLMDYLFDLEDMAQHRRHGRPPSLGPVGYVRLLLFYLGSTMSYKHLCMIFGLTPTVCGRTINWMLRKTVQALSGHPLAKVRFPDRDKMREYAALVQ